MTPSSRPLTPPSRFRASCSRSASPDRTGRLRHGAFVAISAEMRSKLVAALLAAGMASACGMHPDPSQTPQWVGTVSHKLQLMKADRASTYMKQLVESL